MPRARFSLQPEKPQDRTDVETVLVEEHPRRLRWWNSVALVPRFVGTFLDLLHEVYRRRMGCMIGIGWFYVL